MLNCGVTRSEYGSFKLCHGSHFTPRSEQLYSLVAFWKHMIFYPQAVLFDLT